MAETGVMQGSKIEQDARWRAVLERDRRHDGEFVYGVLTTGVYCRPSCPSRRPRRENARIYASPADAERDGLRACLRCRPDEAAADSMVHLCRFIESRADQKLTLAVLAHEAGLSESHLQRRFRKEIGVSPREYVETCRMHLLQQELRNGANVTKAAAEAGYGSSSRLHERAAKRLGVTLRAYRDGSPAEEIGYAILSTRLGSLLVAGTSRGVCQVALGDRRDALVDALRAEYPRAKIIKDSARAKHWAEAVRQAADGLTGAANVPLDIRATAFQRRVWDFLMTIPRGETRTYSEVAGALGRPTASRAVARACATNPVALVVPCHRVIRGDGSLAGYRWGIDQKKKLLDAEKTTA
jgi:AraC family transcriptional regulator of adaptative response/methylated-DNA-[protein]-cysteine methyltransferase